jgi:uncharacterized repeat protein (TIGR02543 family)
VVNLQAIAADGYQFVNWTGDVADVNSASTTVTMTAAKTVTANFTLIPVIMVTSPNGGENWFAAPIRIPGPVSIQANGTINIPPISVSWMMAATSADDGIYTCTFRRTSAMSCPCDIDRILDMAMHYTISGKRDQEISLLDG